MVRLYFLKCVVCSVAMHSIEPALLTVLPPNINHNMSGQIWRHCYIMVHVKRQAENTSAFHSVPIYFSHYCACPGVERVGTEATLAGFNVIYRPWDVFHLNSPSQQLSSLLLYSIQCIIIITVNSWNFFRYIFTQQNQIKVWNTVVVHAVVNFFFFFFINYFCIIIFLLSPWGNS